MIFRRRLTVIVRFGDLAMAGLGRFRLISSRLLKDRFVHRPAVQRRHPERPQMAGCRPTPSCAHRLLRAT